MTIIKATCPVCGTVDLGIADVRVVVAAKLGRATYSFRCPLCREEITKHAAEDVIQLLRGAGCHVEQLHIPDEYIERQRQFADMLSFPPDDLLDFVRLLEDPQTDVVAEVERLAHEP